MDPLSILSAIAASLSIIDKISTQIEKFVKRKPSTEPEAPHQVIAIQQGEAIHFKRDNAVVETITTDDMKKLDPASQQLIKALDQSIQQQYVLWVKLYPQRDQSPDPLVNAKVEAQLHRVAERMCGDLENLLAFLQSMGKSLYDHYDSMLFVCRQVHSLGSK